MVKLRISLCKFSEFLALNFIHNEHQNHSENQFLSFCHKKPGAVKCAGLQSNRYAKVEYPLFLGE